MKVVITGAKGFIGRELVSQCKKQGIKVISIDIIESSEKNYYKADITSKEISEIIPERTDVIIHLAALSRDSDCRDKAYDCFNLNVMGTLNLIEAAQKKNVKQFIFASSEWVYDNFTKNEVKNEDSFINIANHNSEYALSKLVSEANLRQKYQHGFCPVTILRFGIIYGPRETNLSAVESLFDSVNTKEEIAVGSLKTGRCFIHVSDIASGIIKSIGLEGFNIINLQGNRLITLKDIIETSKKILNKNPKIIEKDPNNISIRNVSNKKAKRLLNWEPKIDLQILKQKEFVPVAKKRIKRIALVSPFQVTTNGYDMESVRNKGQLAEVPLGLAYISAYIKKYGYEVKVFDAHIMAVKGFTIRNYSSLKEVEDELISQIVKFNPDVVGISCLFHYIYRTAHQIASRIKTKIKDVTIVMGGAYPTVSPEIALSDKNIDFVVLGEGEKAFLNLLEALNGKINFDELTAIAYRDKKSKIIIKSRFVLLNSLDDIPLPDRTDFVLEDYYRYGRHFIQKFEEYEDKELKIATLTATRGCVFNCSFCLGKKLWGGSLRIRSPKNVLNEIEFLKKKYGIKYFAFNDDNLLINKKFARELLQGIIKRRLNIKWTTGGMSVCGLDEEMIELMVKSGCLIFNLAIESASKKTLENIHKPVTTDEAVRVVNMIRKHKDTYIMGLFMLGFLEETEEQFFETIKFGKELKFDWTLYSCVTPFPGTELYYEAKTKGMLPENIEDDFEQLDFKDYVLNPRHLSREFILKERYFANLDQNFFENPNLSNGKTEIALSDFKNVIKLSPTHASAYYCIGRIYENKGERTLAKQYYRLAKENLSGLHKEYFDKLEVEIP